MYGTAGTREGIELVLKNGATACFNHREELYWKNIVVGLPVHFLHTLRKHANVIYLDLNSLVEKKNEIFQ